MSEKGNHLFSQFIVSDVDEKGEDIIQLITSDEEESELESTPDELAIMPIKNTVLFPGVIMPITVSRKKSIKLVKQAYKSGDRLIGVVTQKKDKVEDPKSKDLFKIGTIAKIVKNAGNARRQHHSYYTRQAAF